jgi:hypothetical protein
MKTIVTRIGVVMLLMSFIVAGCAEKRPRAQISKVPAPDPLFVQKQLPSMAVHKSVTSSVKEDVYWSWAKNKDTVQAYRCFIYDYPGSPRVGEAKERWAQLDFERAERKGTALAYRRFLRSHPKSKFSEEVSKKAYPDHSGLPDVPACKRAMEILRRSLEDPNWSVCFNE